MINRPQHDPVISFVIPCRNEEANVREITAAVIKEMEPIGLSFEIILIDNESQDSTVAVARELCAADSRIKLIINTRNFGQMRSPTHAIFQTRGQAVIGMCADFEDPPHMISQFIARWKAGIPIVLGVRETEKNISPFSNIGRNLFYSFAKRFGDYPIIPDATGFGLYDRKVVDAIATLNEPEPFFRGLLVETGYQIETIPYTRTQRARGKSNNNFFVLLDFALSGVAGASKKLVRLPFLIGALALVATAISFGVVVVRAFTGGDIIFWLITAIIEIQLSMLFIFLGLIGDQVRLVSERTRGMPLVLERERINFPDAL
jgi:polyisoprenyl-phosphate glycosyltransferase